MLKVLTLVAMLLAGMGCDRAETVAGGATAVPKEAVAHVSPEQARQRLADLNKDYSPAEYLASADNGDNHAVTLFIESGMSVDALGKEGETALMRAAVEGHVETLKLLLTNKANVNAESSAGLTALIVAASNGRLPAVKVLCDHGARVDTKSRTGTTALYAAVSENEVDVAQYLLSKGADPALKDALGNTPPLVAVQRKHYSSLEPFLKNTPLLDSTNLAGFAVVDYLRGDISSGDKGAEESLEKLRAAGASLLTQHYFHATRDTLAKMTLVSANSYARQLSEGKKVEEPFSDLLAKYVAQFETNSFPATKVPLLYLVAAEALGKARFAFQSGLSSFGPSDGEKAASEALNEAQKMVLGRYEASLKTAMNDPGFDPNSVDDQGRTPLRVIASTGNIELAKALLEKGADPNRADARGDTPVRAAEQANKPEMVALLSGKRRQE